MSMRSDVTTLTAERCDVECLNPEHVKPLLGRVVGPDRAAVVADALSLLADPTRVRVLHTLSLAEELCVCDLALLLGMSQSAISHQLRLLRGAGVVARRKEGRLVYYRLSDDHVRRILADALGHAAESEAEIRAGA